MIRRFFSYSALALAGLASLVLGGCIASEPLDMECDIESIEILVDDPLSIFEYESQTRQELKASDAYPIVFTVKSGVEIGSYKTLLQTSRNSSVYMLNEKGDVEIPFENGSVVDYADGVVKTFVVRSQDKKWHRTYTVQFVEAQNESFNEPFTIEFNFDEDSYRLFGKNPNNNNYYIWEETNPLNIMLFAPGDPQWKNGNPGFKIANSSKSPMEYPTIPLKGGGPDGSDCLQLKTLSAGKMGEDVGCPNASGSLFNGKFDPQKALASKSEALKATLFGIPFAHVPTMLEADVKLVEVGIAYDDNKQPFTDEPDIYCVIYDNQGQTFVLDGGNVLTSPNIVGIARLPHLYNGIYDKLTNNPVHGLIPGGDWQHISLPVDYNPFDKSSIDNSKATREKAIDVNKLNKKGYSVVIGASSSWQGGNFNAYIGQCILIDNIKLTCVDPVGAGGGDDDPVVTPELKMSFDGNSALNAKGTYYEWTESSERLLESLFAVYPKWGTTNNGFGVFRNGQKPESYPVTPTAGVDGQGVSLKTIDNATMGTMVGNYFTPGVMFIGYEEQTTSPQSISPTMLKMGTPFNHKPIRLSAYLKYKPGQTYLDEMSNPKAGMKDEPDLFCVVYKNTGVGMIEAPDLFTHPNIVGVGRLYHPIHGVGTGWTQVSIDIRYNTELTSADFASGQYSIVIGAASSYNFAIREGAVGSELCVDNIVLEYEQ